MSYVLKRMSKSAVIARRQQAHILNENRILVDTIHSCIVRSERGLDGRASLLGVVSGSHKSDVALPVTQENISITFYLTYIFP